MYVNIMLMWQVQSRTLHHRLREIAYHAHVITQVRTVVSRTNPARRLG